MDESIDVSWSEHKTATQLEGILSQLLLREPLFLRLLAVGKIVGPQQVKNVCFTKLRSAICLSLVVDKQRKSDPGFVAENLRVVCIPQPDRGQVRASLLELPLMLAQLRGVLPAEDSTIMAQENEDRRSGRPQRSKLDRFVVQIGKRDWL